MRNDEFHQLLKDEIGEAVPFEPMACYNADGDCIEFHLSNENYHASSIDGWVTVYCSESTGAVVGGLVKGVKKSLLRRYPGIKIDFEGETVRLSVLVRASAYGADDELAQRKYRRVLDAIEADTNRSLEVEMLQEC